MAGVAAIAPMIVLSTPRFSRTMDPSGIVSPSDRPTTEMEAMTQARTRLRSAPDSSRLLTSLGHMGYAVAHRVAGYCPTVASVPAVWGYFANIRDTA